jgi:hypothetical protein
MSGSMQILPGTGRGTMRSMVEGACDWARALLLCFRSMAPSTAVPAVPLPVPGRTGT